MKVHQVLRNDLQALEAVRPPDADRHVALPSILADVSARTACELITGRLHGGRRKSI
jgi:hypothetical protein